MAHSLDHERETTITTPEFFFTPGSDDRNRELFHYAQAVKIGDRIELAGQGGWNDDWEFPGKLSDETDQAFRNIERTLAIAGASWEHLVTVRSYHVDIDATTVEGMADRRRHHMPDQPPVWTSIGGAALGDEKMRVEIEVTAVLPN